MTERRKGHRWEPITDVPAALRSTLFPELDALVAVFDRRRGEMEGASALREFQARMVRSWSIETGILERLYTLSESATLTLLEQGFDAALLSHGDSDLPPEQLVAILRDHQDAAEGLFQFVRGGRSLSTSYVRELHQALTRHQLTCDAMDAQGNWVKVPLRRGDWKVLPNNPGDVKTGEIWHQYSPPEQVASEMDRLVALHAQHGDVHYVVEAAWLHHRFTQIHPFQDGNGRVARALASLVCIRGRGFPLVVMRDQKIDYIQALEQADRGDLAPLVAMFERQQRTAFMKAVGLSQQVLDERSSIDAIVADAKRRIEDALVHRNRALVATTEVLMSSAERRLTEVAAVLRASLGKHLLIDVARSVEATEHWFRWQIVQAAKSLGYYANLSAKKSWVRLRIREASSTSSLLVAFHHTGRLEDAVMAASALMVRIEGDASAGEPPSSGSQPAADSALTYTAGRDPAELSATFAAWLDRAVTVGLDLWRRGL